MTRILLAESGGSKTDWLFWDDHQVTSLKTVGFNPNVLPLGEIRRILMDQVVPWIGPLHPQRIYFFGAGMGQSGNRLLIGNELRHHFQPEELCVETDLLAAAYAGLGKNPGLMAIMGTGSVAFRYDGRMICERHGGWGYILGDEGGGSALGRTLIRKYLEKALSPHLVAAFQAHLGLEDEEILQRVYQSNPPAQFLAAQVPFIAQTQDDPGIREILVHQFNAFLELYLLPLKPQPTDGLVLIGGVARTFAPLIQELFAPAFPAGIHVLEEAPGHRLLDFLREHQP
ncbi:MAG: hypothetical protein KDC71_23885 [Acidobacteria bacterium]|nr:hypothetical protein [Acidobacteriota bacterium]